MKIHVKAMAIAATILLSAVLPQKSLAQNSSPSTANAGREKLLMDFGWRFAFGNAVDPTKDFDPDPAGTGFSYFAKAGTAAGAAAADFDDRGWRPLNLPHDWAVEVPFSERGSGSHGY